MKQKLFFIGFILFTFTFALSSQTYCNIDKRVTESCGGFGYDDVKSHALWSAEIKVNGETKITLPSATKTFNYLQDTDIILTDRGETLTITVSMAKWAENIMIGFDWNRDGIFEDVRLAWEGGRTGAGLPGGVDGQNSKTWTIVVPDDAVYGASRLRIIVDGITCTSSYSPNICGNYGLEKIGYAGSIHDLGLDVKNYTGLQKIAVSKGSSAMIVGNMLCVIDLNQGDRVEIFDVLGRKIKSTTASDSPFETALSGKGIYLIRISGKENKILKVVK